MESRWLEPRIARCGARLRSAVAGLDAADFELHPFAGKWSIGEYVHHIVEVDLGWTDIMYEAVAPDPEINRPYVKDWNAALIERSRRDVASALDVFDQNHTEVLAFLSALPDAAFTKIRPGVKWLKTNNIPYQINDNANWGLVMHVDHSLRYVHKTRVAIGKPLEWMATIKLEHPPGSGRAKDGGDTD